MQVKQLGEFALIERFRKSIRTDTSVIAGSGDDCAAIKFDKDNYLLFNTDMIVEAVDFLPEDKPELIGRKAVAVALSDIAACAGIPHYCLVCLGMPAETSVERIERIFAGILSMARNYKVNIVGGDLSRAKRLSIDISMLGLVEKKHLVLRKGAKRGDIIFVSGNLGGSFSGKHLRFTPRLKEARFLVTHLKLNSMIDISDGLAQDLGHILQQTKVGAVLYEDLIPLSKQAQGIKDALYTGEDFELLFSVSHQEAKKLMSLRNPFSFKPIGEITPEKGVLRLVDKRGKEKIIPTKGFQHF